MLERLLKLFPYVRQLEAASRNNDAMARELAAIHDCNFYVPPGHFYSPIPSKDYIAKAEGRLHGRQPASFPGFDLREKDQLALLEQFRPFYDTMPFGPQKTGGLRYFFDNPAYSYSDATFLHCMIRHARPRRIVEVGSGYSSCVMLDTNEKFLGGGCEITFVEPYPELLLSLITEEDKRSVTLLQKNLQETDIALFAGLRENDILFIDSTHVGKVLSDVNHVFFEILPVLAPGVFVHFHDIFYPFEYPLEWIRQNRAWNEIYMLRAFLTYNASFRIVAFNTYLEHFHRAWFEKNMPLCLKNYGGSIWLQKLPAA